MPVVYLTLALVGCLAVAAVLTWAFLCRHRYEYVRHISLCRRLLHCRKCKRYFEQNIGVPGAPIVPALEEDLPPRARLP